MKKEKIVVVHNGRRDNYQVARALSEAGHDVHLVTDFYYQPSHPFSFMAKVVFGKSVWKRYEAGLKVVIHSSAGLLFMDYLERLFPRNETVNRMRGFFLGRKASKVIERTGARKAIFYYNCGIAHLPERISQNCSITLFQMHPHPQAIRSIYDSYLEVRPELIEELRSQEEEMTHNTGYFHSLLVEIQRSDKVICTSNFSKQTLISAGVDAGRIHRVPYGFPQGLDTPPEVPDAGLDYALRLSFVGQFVVRKGVFELVKMMLSQPEIELTIYTREAAFARRTIARWLGQLPTNITVKCILDDKALWADARQRDFLVLPSLVEGFGLVITEAMAHGLPVICSRNTVGPDVIVDGETGFLIDGTFAPDIENACNRAIEKRNTWRTVRERAKCTARSRSWRAFRAQISELTET